MVKHDQKPVKPNVRFIHLPKRIRIRDIRKEDVDRFCTLEGIIIRASEVRPRISTAVWKCGAGHFSSRTFKFGRFSEPAQCDTCKLKRIELAPKRSTFIDSQTGRIQENLESQKAGEQPQQLHIDIEDDLCGQIVPGERVILNGFVRSRQITARGEKTGIFELFLQVNSIERDERNYGEIEISPEEEQEIIKISKSPDLFKVVSQSILPAIFGFEEEKKGIALYLFSGHQETFNGKKIRHSVHLFFGGDPGISKSTMMLMLRDITPRSIYISGKSTSAAGLTFTMRQDEHDKRWVADAGAAVLADDSCLFVDELAQMEKPDIMALNEFMETQIIPVAKAGINAILQARDSVMVALNPKHGRFDMTISLADQIDPKIPPQLISRFDLIYLVPDVPEEKRDMEEATAILRLWQGKTTLLENQIPLPLLQKYIAYARRKKNPKMNDAVVRVVAEKFVAVRKLSNGGSVTITKRALESLARLSTAHAIMRLANEVTIQDAEAAIKVYEHSLRQCSLDPNTKKFDADRVTGKTHEKRKLSEEIERIISAQDGQKCTKIAIINEIQSKSPNVAASQIENLLEEMRLNGVLLEVRTGVYSIMKK